MLNIIIFGSPGAGKGTQAQLIAKKYKLVHLSSGEILRQKRGQGELGRKISLYQDQGRLVPNSLIIKTMDSAINHQSLTQGLIFDGYPRNLAQVKALARALKKHNQEISIVLNLQLNQNQAIQRILLRGQSSGRLDDNLKTLKSRFQVYRIQTAPLIKYYRNQNKLINIDGQPTIQTIFKEIDKILKKL